MNEYEVVISLSNGERYKMTTFADSSLIVKVKLEPLANPLDPDMFWEGFNNGEDSDFVLIRPRDVSAISVNLMDSVEF